MKNCIKCGELLSKEATFCPKCNAIQPKKKNTLKIVLIIICGIILVGVIGSLGNSDDSNNNKYEKNKENKVNVIDFSSMTEAEIDSWCNDNKINCSINSEYSDTIAKDKFIKQSINKDQTIYEGDNIVITLSLGKEPTTEQKNALKKAQSYSNTMNMSKQGIYKQLTSTIEGFDKEAAQYAIDNIEADWNKNALEKAKSYQNNMNMSKNAIYKQLTSVVEGFTKEEAQYAIDHLEE